MKLFYNTLDAYSITFPTNKETDKAGEKTGEKTREKIIYEISNNPSISMLELAEKIGITSKGIEWQVNQLKKEGILKRVGPDKGGYWEVRSE